MSGGEPIINPLSEYFDPPLRSEGSDTPILFLDIDGVLNGDGSPHFPPTAPKVILERLRESQLEPERVDFLCEHRVSQLNKVLDAVPNTRVVLSSTWRLWGVSNVLECLKMVGYRYDISDITPIRFSYVPRDHEISSWFYEEGLSYRKTKFCILDDLQMSNIPDFSSHHVQTTSAPNIISNDIVLDTPGFSNEHVVKAVRFLSGRQFYG